MNPMSLAVQTANLQDDRQVALLKAGLHALGHLAELTPHRSLERVSHLLGIYRAASALFSHRQSSLLRWLHAANTASPFAGSSPIDVILTGCNLDEVRGYLECQLVA